MHPSEPRFIVAATPFEIVKRRRRKRPSGSIGAGARRSAPTNATAAASATAAETRTTGDVTLSCPASISANVVAARVSAPSPTPGTSRRRPRGSALSVTRRAVRTAAAATIGRLTRNTQRQPGPATSRPPAIGPAGSDSPATAAQTPIARARSAPPGNVCVMIASVPGSSSAAPTPCTPRAPTSTPVDGAAPAAAARGRPRAGRERRHAEQPQPAEHDAPVAVQVADRAAGEHEAGERDRVAVDDPLQPRRRRLQLLADARQRDVDDRDVELDEEQPGAHDDEDDAPSGHGPAPYDGRAAARLEVAAGVSDRRD